MLATLSTQALAGLSTDTMKVCEKAKAYGPALFESLESVGWNTLEKKHWKRFERRSVDGFGLLYVGHGTEPLDWTEVKKRGQSYTSAVKKWISSTDKAMAFVDSDNPEAVLVVLNMTKGNQQGFECVYAGPSDKKTDAKIDKLVRSFNRKGIKQANSEAHIAYGEYSSALGTPPKRARMAVQVARYLEPMNEIWGRPARVETAFFVQKQTKK
ncbi:hypothetical protein [Shimia gijangensis]|uniref:hypothetical protein n=1 Tax=Shimia gijangensis TaxID=1470563 RepID=UPI0011149E33|nr:hypothetical protein [Shimia gijangensis]